MSKIGALVAGVCLFALVGCGGPQGGEGNSAAGGGEKSATSSDADGGNMQLKPGQWEMSFEMTNVSAPGMPAGAADMMRTPKTTVKSCLSEAEASKPDADLFQGKKDDSCKAEGFAMKGGRVTGTMICKGTEGAGETKLTMEGQYGSTSFDVTSRTEVKGEGMAMTMESRSTGRRIGDCPAGAPADG